jgi:DNA-binding response OmpR family regulator
MKKILVVDDDPQTIIIQRKILRREGYQVDSAPNGMVAKYQILKTDYDLIILDIMMPDTDGFEMSRWIKQNQRKGKIPIVFVSAKDDQESKKKGFEAGGSFYLTKPFTSNQLTGIVKMALGE